MDEKQSLFRLELNVITPVPRTVTKYFKTLKVLLAMKFTEDLIKEILDMKVVIFKGDVYSPEYKRYFKTERSVAEIKQHPEKPDKYEQTIDGVDDTNWCRRKYRESLEALGIKPNEPKKNQGQRR
jgi:hypothetical protein